MVLINDLKLVEEYFIRLNKQKEILLIQQNQIDHLKQHLFNILNQQSAQPPASSYGKQSNIYYNQSTRFKKNLKLTNFKYSTIGLFIPNRFKLENTHIFNPKVLFIKKHIPS